jgi:DNA modification methylase
MVAFALRADGWYLRSDIIWHKPNPMPESVTDRPTKSHEYIFLLTKSAKYFYDADAIKEDSDWSGDPRAGYGRLHYRGKREGEKGTGQENFVQITEKRNKRSVWTVNTQPYKEAHFATFPPKLIEPCILAGCPKGGIVLDPFGGSGTTGEVAEKYNRKWVLIELNKDYKQLAQRRTAQQSIDL